MEVMHRVYVAPWAKSIAHKDNRLVQIIQDNRIAVFGEMVVNLGEDKQLVYARYTIGAKDNRGGVSKRGVRRPESLLEGCSVLDLHLEDDWIDAPHNLAQRLNKAFDVAEEAGDRMEEIDILHTVNPVKVREDQGDFRPRFISSEVAEDAVSEGCFSLQMTRASNLQRVVADQLVISIPPARLGWKWNGLAVFDDYACSHAIYPRYAYQHLVAACRGLDTSRKGVAP